MSDPSEISRRVAAMDKLCDQLAEEKRARLEEVRERISNSPSPSFADLAEAIRLGLDAEAEGIFQQLLAQEFCHLAGRLKADLEGQIFSGDSHLKSDIQVALRELTLNAADTAFKLSCRIDGLELDLRHMTAGQK